MAILVHSQLTICHNYMIHGPTGRHTYSHIKY